MPNIVIKASIPNRLSSIYAHSIPTEELSPVIYIYIYIHTGDKCPVQGRCHHTSPVTWTFSTYIYLPSYLIISPLYRDISPAFTSYIISYFCIINTYIYIYMYNIHIYIYIFIYIYPHIGGDSRCRTYFTRPSSVVHHGSPVDRCWMCPTEWLGNRRWRCDSDDLVLCHWVTMYETIHYGYPLVN